MTEMGSKKDPGKFTVRFNLCDPQQRQAAELLNRQGRSKAQFIANAILNYVGDHPPTPRPSPTMDSGQLRQLIEDVLAQRQEQDHEELAYSPADNDALNDAERCSILQTLDAFQQQ